MQTIDAVVTGATGLLGSHVVQRLVEDGARVRCLVRPTSRTEHIEGPQVELVQVDLHQPAALAQALKGARAVLHFAGHLTASAPLNTDEKDADYSLNVESTKALLEAAALAGVGHFVYASSVGVYGVEAVSPIGEDTPPNPVSAYGRSKVVAEAAVMEYHRRGLPGTVIRPAICYGAGDRHFLPAARRLVRLPVLPLVGGGRHLLDIVSAIDVAGLAVAAAFAPAAAGRVYNAASGHPGSLRDIIAILHELEGTPRPLIVPVSEGLMRFSAPVAKGIVALLAPGMESTMSSVGAAYSARDVYYDMSRAAAELGFRPRYDFRGGLERALETEGSAVRRAAPAAR
jgi:nucleoside-diphosphate-sugar epimerase